MQVLDAGANALVAGSAVWVSIHCLPETVECSTSPVCSLYPNTSSLPEAPAGIHRCELTANSWSWCLLYDLQVWSQRLRRRCARLCGFPCKWFHLFPICQCSFSSRSCKLSASFSGLMLRVLILLQQSNPSKPARHPLMHKPRRWILSAACKGQCKCWNPLLAVLNFDID